MSSETITATASGSWKLGDLTVNRLGFGAMRITGKGIWGAPKSREQAISVLRRAVEKFARHVARRQSKRRPGL